MSQAQTKRVQRLRQETADAVRAARIFYAIACTLGGGEASVLAEYTRMMTPSADTMTH